MQTFSSKIGLIFYASSALVLLASVYVIYVAIIGAMPLFFALLIAAAMSGLIIWIWVSTHYTVTAQNTLIIRCGPFTRTLAINTIQSVSRSNNPISSPALSLDRLLIRYDNRQVLISPKETDDFLNAIGHSLTDRNL